jgi:nitrate/TMAO reductase-like tetraheme cytochrome c subunit
MLPSPLVALSSSSMVFGEIALATVLLALVLLKPGIVRTLEGKVLVLLALFLAPAIAAYGGVSEHIERTRTTGYCLSCHVMSDYGKSLSAENPAAIPASHYQNNRIPRDHACISCHTEYGLSGDHRAMARFTRNALETYLGRVPEKLRARRTRNRECLRCHVGARSFEKNAAHQDGAAPLVSLAAIKAGKISCTKSGCHHSVHDVRAVAMATPSEPAPGTPPAATPPASITVPGPNAAPPQKPAHPAAPADTVRAAPLFGPFQLFGPSPRNGS